MFQVAIVDQVHCVVRFKAIQVSIPVLSDDFARRDLFCEVVAVVWNQAVEPLVSECCFSHPDLFFGAGSDFKINALLQCVATVREETEAPNALFLARQRGVTDVDVPQVVPAVTVVAVVCTRRVEAHPRIVVLGRVGDAESDGLTMIKRQHLEVR